MGCYGGKSLAGDGLASGGTPRIFFLIIFAMIGIPVALAYLSRKVQASALLISALVILGGVFLADVYLAFPARLNLNTSYLYLEVILFVSATVSVEFIAEQKNKNFLRLAFSKYAPPAVVDSIVRERANLSLGGVKKELSVLFSDIRGFTSIAERMDAGLLSGFLNEYFGIMTDIVFNHQGTLDKYIGDALMAFWGAPVENSNHASGACQAAIAMMQALRKNQEGFQQRYGFPLAIGIGINSGFVNVGNMGSSRSFGYTVIGDQVNLASRLEAATKTYGVGIITTQSTLNIVKASGSPIPQHRILDLSKVRGRNQSLEILQVFDSPVPPQALLLFEEARQLYLKRDWKAATKTFVEADAQLSLLGLPDMPCQIYQKRCKQFLEKPPGEEWDGSWAIG